MSSTPELLGRIERRRLVLAYRRLLPDPAGAEPTFAAVLADLRAHPGSLTRGQLAWGLAVALGGEHRAAYELAVALECFHSASLVFDDLPAMDDAEQRRGRPCPHRVWGEGAAILGGLALVNRGYELLWRVLGDLPRERRQTGARLVGDCLGARGVLGGQARDLAFAPAEAAADEVQTIALGKTVPLVRLSLLLPALVTGAAPLTRSRLDALAAAWGLAYQAVDDAKDSLLSAGEAGKTTRRDGTLGRPNLPGSLGWGDALARLAELLDRARGELLALRAEGLRWRGMWRLQRHLEEEAAAVKRRAGEYSACA
jgi:geranylgeranyl pyrophosphate synthase